MAANMEACFAYDDELRRGGHFVGGEALQMPEDARTLRMRDGKVVVTDGPYAETKEHFGGYYVIEARDLDDAIGYARRLPLSEPSRGTFKSAAPASGR